MLPPEKKRVKVLSKSVDIFRSRNVFKVYENWRNSDRFHHTKSKGTIFKNHLTSKIPNYFCSDFLKIYSYLQN